METMPRWLNKRNVIAAVVLLLIAVVFMWVRGHSFIEITVDTQGNSGDITYTLTNQSSGSVDEITTSDTHVKRLVSRGNYEISATHSSGNFFAVRETSGFLKTNRLNATLRQEKKRTFVGDQPDSCMFYNDVLYSYDCGLDFTRLKKHIPATTDTPTYVEVASGDKALLKGVSRFGNSPHMLVQYTDGAEINGSTYAFYPFTMDLITSANAYPLPLDDRQPYSMVAYRSGAIVFNDNLDDIKYFDTPTQQPESISLGNPTDESMNSPVELSTHLDQIGVLYTTVDENEEGIDDSDIEPNTYLEGKGEFLLHSNNTTLSIELDHWYTSGKVCGNQMVCLLSNGLLDIYEVSGSSETNKVVTLRDVLSVNSLGDTLLITTNKYVLAFDTQTLSGYAQYAFGDYSFCGIETDVDQYILCVTDEQEKNSALLIDTNQDNVDSIDKKIAELVSGNDEVEALSMYGTIIHISPDIGELIFDPGMREYRADPDLVRQVNSTINSEIQRIGIDRARYTIINPYDN